MRRAESPSLREGHPRPRSPRSPSLREGAGGGGLRDALAYARSIVPLLLLTACAHAGTGASTKPETLSGEPGWLLVRGVPELRQGGRDDCGETALSMLLRFWSLEPVSGDEAMSAGALRDLAKSRGLEAHLVPGTPADLQRELAAGHPVLVGIAQRAGLRKAITHYELVVGLHPGSGRVATIDPARGWKLQTRDQFEKEWKPSEHLALIAWRSGADAAQ